MFFCSKEAMNPKKTEDCLIWGVVLYNLGYMIDRNNNTVSLEVVDVTENMLGLFWFVSSSTLGSTGVN